MPGKEKIISEDEIVSQMQKALDQQQFVVYYQPQYNHESHLLTGAEALARWIHPEKGIIPPGEFIPVFEKTGFIARLDQYMFEKVCVFLHKCKEEKIPLISISVNLTRYDIFLDGYMEKLEEIRKKYDIPVKYIRIELTESLALGNVAQINAALKKLHDFGYVVEMDDFGSGYSSLNILKDIDFDVVKLDMRFMEAGINENKRGGIILSSVVRMLNWLQLPMIAEGVETQEQASFLESVGCNYIQGYLYSKPIPEEEYIKILKGNHLGKTKPSMELIESMDAVNFWNADSLETLIFSSYVGAAAIFEYGEGKAELLRVNEKYLRELGMNLTEKELIYSNLLDMMDENDRKKYCQMLDKAAETKEEQVCETRRTMKSDCCGDEVIYVRSEVRMIGRSNQNKIFYALIRNVTVEKEKIGAILDSERRFKAASEQANIYYWEYTVATKEMRPCFRCMRDLGLPAVLTNYPDSAIEMGVFPPEVADMYRDWHRQIAEGVPSLEAIIPLTVGRVPFHVRYTTEFDENGHPVKAYGSATLVVDGEKAKESVK